MSLGPRDVRFDCVGSGGDRAQGGCLSQGQVKEDLLSFRVYLQHLFSLWSCHLDEDRNPPTNQAFVGIVGRGSAGDQAHGSGVLGIRPMAQGCWASAYHRALMHSDTLRVNSHFPFCRQGERRLLWLQLI